MRPAGEDIPLSRPALGEREEELLLEAFRSGRLSLGPMQERFERLFASWLGVDDAVAVSSGTAGLHLGVRALGWGEGDEVVTSPFSFVSSANCLLYERARPVFCDVDPFTLNLDPAAAGSAVTERTAGVLAVHILGWPAAMRELEALAARYGLGFLEDACEAIGATDSDGRRVGRRGNAATFGFYPNKQMTTGEGGMLVPPGPREASLYRSERNQGRAPGTEAIEHQRLGFNYRLSELACALGIAQVERLDELLAARAAVAAAYAEQLEPLQARHGEGEEGLLVPVAGRGDERRSWFVYVVQLPVGADRQAVIEALAGQGIPSKPYLPCLHLFPHLQALGYRQVIEHLQGKRPLAETVELVKIRTGQFAKRQMTWFRRQLQLTWINLEPQSSAEAVVESIARL